MELWIGPVIVAAAISSVVTAVGWYVTHVRETRLEAARRRDRVRDLQTALRAEIRSHRHRLQTADDAEATAATLAWITTDGFTPFVPRGTPPFVFDATVRDLHLLPTHVIDPIVLYYTQVHVIAQFAEDLRSDRYANMAPERKAAMYADYVAMNTYAKRLAEGALAALEPSPLGCVSSSASDQSDPSAASGRPAGAVPAASLGQPISTPSARPPTAGGTDASAQAARS